MTRAAIVIDASPGRIDLECTMSSSDLTMLRTDATGSLVDVADNHK